ncbi:type II toxin-antitoxin system HicB family antitoxin [Hoeflea olei]|uniref:type II toxin-antitoxin system HicB family antitoxin n=1 Tax=Hoeflea olei TaxID=1480615 RepID=UPI0009F66CEB|nr:type II toxin-antitoxin system HicB family antitoxin [Hoeflea olei]
MRTVTYKGYQASVEFDNGALFIKVLHISDILLAECDKASEVENVARELIDDYLEDCREEGREPAVPFKGSFNVRVAPEVHKHAAMAAAEAGISLNSWIGRAIQEKLECSSLSKRMDGLVSSTETYANAHFARLTQHLFNDWHQQKSVRSQSMISTDTSYALQQRHIRSRGETPWRHESFVGISND